jgi:hypothetical protein
MLFPVIIAPELKWKAGHGSECMRKSATMALRALSQGLEPELAQKLVLQQITTLTELAEDNDPVTRSNSLDILLLVGPLGLEQLRPLAFTLQARLDESSTCTRQSAAMCLGRLQLDQTTATIVDQESWANALKQIVPIMLVHMDDPDRTVKRYLIGKCAGHTLMCKVSSQTVAATAASLMGIYF